MMSLKAIASRVVAANPQAAHDYREGNSQAASFLIDEVMRKTHGIHGESIVREAVTSEIMYRR